MEQLTHVKGMNLATYKDTDLVAMLTTGDRHAFEVIYDRYADDLYKYIHSRVHTRQYAEEIIQELFVMLWMKRHVLTISHSLKAYLFAAAKYVLINQVRSDNVRKKYIENIAPYVAHETDNSTEEYLEFKDIQRQIEKIISELPSKRQTAYRLSRNQYLPIQDIAARMNISTRTVENHITQALKHLRTRLEEL